MTVERKKFSLFTEDGHDFKKITETLSDNLVFLLENILHQSNANKHMYEKLNDYEKRVFSQINKATDGGWFGMYSLNDLLANTVLMLHHESDHFCGVKLWEIIELKKTPYMIADITKNKTSYGTVCTLYLVWCIPYLPR